MQKKNDCNEWQPVNEIPMLPMMEFELSGYGEGKCAPSEVAPVWCVRPSGKDDTALLQLAIDDLAVRSRDTPNFCGALQLLPGTFRVEGSLRIEASGIVIRGWKAPGLPTRIIAAGPSRRSLLDIRAGEVPVLGEPVAIASGGVTAGARTIPVVNTRVFQVGDRIAVHRPCTREWISALGMDTDISLFADERTHWLPGSRDLRWDRVVVGIDSEASTITLDAPITTAIEFRYGGGWVAKVISGGPIMQVGIEDLILESTFDQNNPKDEEHAWIGISLDQVEDAWVRRVTVRHFSGSAVRVGHGGRRITLEDCHNVAPVSEIGGYRRQSFLIYGQQVLVRRCTAEAGLNDFAVGRCAVGPNVFRDCEANGALGPSGAFESWASAVLYERVRIRGAGLRLDRMDDRSQGGGWSAVHSAVVDCEAAEIRVQGPDGAENFLKEGICNREKFTTLGCEQTSQDAAVDVAAIPEFTVLIRPTNLDVAEDRPLQIKNGRFVAEGRMVWGGQINTGWWKGQLGPRAGEYAGVSITRFAPGQYGSGLTEHLPALVERMEREEAAFFGNGPAIWYDRRRDDHTVAARLDGNVWAPFYEMPWARSGHGVAWDGLSKYDLTKFSPWYFERTREFAKLCEQRGLVLYHHLYNTHNLLESPAHWVDFPWRPVNCVNETGLPEPAQVDDHGAIHLAAQFYNVDHPGRRELHRAYIRHTLEQLGDCPNVIFSLAFQFSGPLAFQEFFLDTVAEWEREKKSQIKVALVTSKDITDAILDEPMRSGQVDVVDTRYWQPQPDGTLWAPRGDCNKAFREMTWKQFGSPYGDLPPDTTPLCVYLQVRQYRDRFPDKAIVAWHGGAGSLPVLMAGGAQALMRNPASGQSQGIEPDQNHLDRFVRKHLIRDLMRLAPQDGWVANPESVWCLSDASGKTVLFSSLAGTEISLLRSLPCEQYTGLWFCVETGETLSMECRPLWREGEVVCTPNDETWLLLLK